MAFLNSRTAIGQRSVTLAKLWGTIASPVATLTGTTGALFTLPSAIAIPANTIGDYDHIHVRARCKRTGANATGQFEVQLGTGAAGSDSLFGRVSINATDGHVGALETQAFFNTSATIFLSNGTVAPMNTTSGTTFIDRNTNVNRGSVMYVTFGMSSANALDSFALLGYHITLER
jgi:hypothetical protein